MGHRLYSASLSSLDSEEQESLRTAERLHNRSSRNSTGGISTHSLNEAELAVGIISILFYINYILYIFNLFICRRIFVNIFFLFLFLLNFVNFYYSLKHLSFSLSVLTTCKQRDFERLNAKRTLAPQIIPCNRMPLQKSISTPSIAPVRNQNVKEETTVPT